MYSIILRGLKIKMYIHSTVIYLLFTCTTLSLAQNIQTLCFLLVMHVLSSKEKKVGLTDRPSASSFRPYLDLLSFSKYTFIYTLPSLSSLARICTRFQPIFLNFKNNYHLNITLHCHCVLGCGGTCASWESETDEESL